MTDKSNKVALILAAGKGKRMKSELPKALHKLDGKYIVDHVIDSARKAGIDRQLLVIGHRAEQVRQALADRNIEFVLQEQQLGTGHAVKMAAPLLEGFDGDLVVLCGDMPLVRPETIRGLIDKRHRLDAAAVVLTAMLDDPGHYGRIVKDDSDLLRAIVEYRDADDEIRKINEVNTGAFCFDWKSLKAVLGKIDDKNDQKEYYLTDSVALLVASGRKVGAQIVDDPVEGFGVNSVAELAEVERIIKSGTG